MGCSNSVPMPITSSKGTLLAIPTDRSPKATQEQEHKADQQVTTETPPVAPTSAETTASVDDVKEKGVSLEMVAKEVCPKAVEPEAEPVASVADADAEAARIKVEEDERAAVAAEAARINAGEEAPATAAAEDARVKAEEEERATAAVPVVPENADPRFDFGPGFFTRCSTCRALSKNRGDEDSRKVYCRRCYHSEEERAAVAAETARINAEKEAAAAAAEAARIKAKEELAAEAARINTEEEAAAAAAEVARIKAEEERAAVATGAARINAEEAAAAAAAEEARIKAKEEEKAAAAAPAAHEKADPRFDFGPGFFTRCSTCRALSKNRGDKDSRKVYCRRCYRPRANEPSSEAAEGGAAL